MTQPSFFSTYNFLFSFGVISVLFGLMFKILPDAKIKWKHVWLGSIVTGILFTIGKTWPSISALQILRLFMELQAPSF
jgi:uncharacterized BrkB/YihY/UPF0761 family membrane protein